MAKKKKRTLSPRQKTAQPEPVAKLIATIAPLIGISLDKGLLIAVMTDPDDAELTDFRMAIDRPFFKMLAAPAARCRVSHTTIRDEKAGVDRKAYLAFIPVPAKAVIDGVIPCGAKVGKDPVFFTVSTEQFGKMDRDKLRKILFVLHPLFEAVLPQVLPAKHDLLTEFAPITAARRRNERWQRIKAEVKTHLEAKAPEKALGVLEPLVFTKQPFAEAEKLLGEMLYAAKRPEREEPAELKALRIERLMLEFTLSRLNRAPRSTPPPKRRAAT
jgi:hypothetical protein